MKRLAVIAVVLFAVTLLQSKPKVRTFIPPNCMHKMTVTNFTKPCRMTGANSAICDGVILKFECVDYRQSPN